MPRPAPVMIATRPSSEVIDVPFCSSWVCSCWTSRASMPESEPNRSDRRVAESIPRGPYEEHEVDARAAQEHLARLDRFTGDRRALEDALGGAEQAGDRVAGSGQRLLRLRVGLPGEVGERHDVGALRQLDRDRPPALDRRVGRRSLGHDPARLDVVAEELLALDDERAARPRPRRWLPRGSCWRSSARGAARGPATARARSRFPGAPRRRRRGWRRPARSS